MSTGSDVYTLAISVWDRPKDDLSDLLAIQSKTRMILSDLRVEFVRGANPFVLPDDDIAITPMKHVKNDRVTGWMLSIDFDAKGFADRCNIPQR
jgi:hypothetical protein